MYELLFQVSTICLFDLDLAAEFYFLIKNCLIFIEK